MDAIRKCDHTTSANVNLLDDGIGALAKSTESNDACASSLRMRAMPYRFAITGASIARCPAEVIRRSCSGVASGYLPPTVTRPSFHGRADEPPGFSSDGDLTRAFSLVQLRLDLSPYRRRRCARSIKSPHFFANRGISPPSCRKWIVRRRRRSAKQARNKKGHRQDICTFHVHS